MRTRSERSFVLPRIRNYSQTCRWSRNVLPIRGRDRKTHSHGSNALKVPTSRGAKSRSGRQSGLLIEHRGTPSLSVRAATLRLLPTPAFPSRRRFEMWVAHEHPERPLTWGAWVCDCAGCADVLRTALNAQPDLQLVLKSSMDRRLIFHPRGRPRPRQRTVARRTAERSRRLAARGLRRGPTGTPQQQTPRIHASTAVCSKTQLRWDLNRNGGRGDEDAVHD